MARHDKILQVLLVWKGTILRYRLLERPARVSLGDSKWATFFAPRPAGYPSRFPFLIPRKGGYFLRVGPGMRGRVVAGGAETSVDAILQQPPTRRSLRNTYFREVPIQIGDQGTIALDESGDLRILFSTVDPPEKIARPAFWRFEPLFLRTFLTSAGLLGTFAILAMLVWERSPPPTLALTAERMAKIVEPVVEEPAPPEPAQKKKEDEAESKRMKGEKGKLGLKDAPNRDTILPKGREDIIREKVARKGLLGIIGNSKPEGSGLGKLFAQTSSTDMEQAISGLAGGRLVVGRGSGGLSTAGSGTGGGGTGLGRIYGTGDINTAEGGRGRGKGPSLSGRGEREVKVDMKTGDVDTGGSLTKEQVNRVVRAHAASIKYCYEKELQRQPNLAGKIDLYWVIQPDGTVTKSSLAGSSMGNTAVEGCMTRQVKQWQFPKSEGQTVVQSYPFIFKGAV